MATENEPIDIALDDDGDLDVSTGDLRFTTGLEAVAQECRIAVQNVRGEWFLDLDDGIPYYANDTVPEADALLAARFDEARVRAAYRAALLAVDSVIAITQLDVSFDASTRVVTVTWRVRTEFGDTEPDTLTAEATT